MVIVGINGMINVTFWSIMVTEKLQIGTEYPFSTSPSR